MPSDTRPAMTEPPAPAPAVPPAAPSPARNDAFSRQAEQSEGGFFAEFWGLLKHNKKWWLLPVIIALVLVAGLIILGGTAVAPFIYTLF